MLHGELAPGEYRAHRGRCETEAESVADVLANLLGLNTDASSISYLAAGPAPLPHELWPPRKMRSERR